MSYKIHEAAKMLGLTPQTLRFYEKYGIRPGRRTGAGPRSYDKDSIDIMMSLRKYRNCGFTVAQTADLLTCKEPAQIGEAMRDRQAAMGRELERQTRILDAMRRTQNHVEHLMSLEGSRRAMDRPAMAGRLFLARGREEMEKRDMSTLAQWASELPLVRWISLYDESGDPAREPLPAQGFVTGMDMLRFLRLDQGDALHHFPPCRCLEGMISWNSDTHTQGEAVAGFLRDMAQAGYLRCGSPLVCTLMTTTCDDRTRSVGEVWVPIAPDAPERLNCNNFTSALDSHIPS